MYASKQDMIDRFGNDEMIQLTDRSMAGVIDDTVLNRALEDADGEINGYLGSRFTTPVSPVPTTLLRIACDMARYYLYDDNATDQVTKRYNDSIKFLKDIAKGDVSIGIDTLGSTPESSDIPSFESGGNVFNRNDKSFI